MRKSTFTEAARRAQLIEVTIGLVAEHGYAATSLARIAAAAGITKAAVLYHFASKNALVEAAHAQVLTELVTAVGTAVEAAEPADGPAAYVRSMIGYLREHPRHIRVLVEAMTNDATAPVAPDPRSASAARWEPLAALVSAARSARKVPGAIDLRTVALVIGGGIDAIVSESLADPEYDTAAAAELLVAATERAWLGG